MSVGKDLEKAVSDGLQKQFGDVKGVEIFARYIGTKELLKPIWLWY